jgi:hypothetical protein
MDDQGLDTAETGRAAGIAQTVDEALRGLVAAGEVEAQHPAEAVHLRGRDAVLRMIRQARVVHRGDGRMRPDRPREGQAVAVVLADPQRQGPDAPQQQPGVDRAEDGPGDDRGVPDARQEVGRSGEDPGGQVAVAAEVLRGAVPHQIGPEGQRPAVHRCGEGVVGDGQRAGLVGQCGNGAQVGDVEQGVAR